MIVYIQNDSVSDDENKNRKHFNAQKYYNE